MAGDKKQSQQIKFLDNHIDTFYSNKAARERAEYAQKKKEEQAQKTADAHKAIRMKDMTFQFQSHEDSMKTLQERQERNKFNPTRLPLPPQDPIVRRHKWERINPGVPYPDDAS